VDGHEQTIQVNHLAPVLLSHLLRPRLAGFRIINTPPTRTPGGRLAADDLDSKAGRPFPRMFTVYDVEAGNILFRREAARRWPEIESYIYHPCVVRTRFGRDGGLATSSTSRGAFMRTRRRRAPTQWAGWPRAPAADLVAAALRQAERPGAEQATLSPNWPARCGRATSRY